MLSLDAPSVALVWQWQLARVARFPLGWQHAFILGVSTWLAYAADRWIEGWRLAPEKVRTPRHRFYQRTRWPICAVWVALLAADVSVAALHLTPREFCAGLLLLAPVLLYLLSHQLFHRDHRWRAPKEVCVALLISGGTVVFSLAQPAASWRPLLAPLGLFFLLCFANCALISVWEHEIDEAHGQTSLARQSRHAHKFIGTLPWALALAAAAFGLFAAPPVRAAIWCAAASGALLGAIDLRERRLGWQLARVLADAALLTPLLALLA